MQSLALEIHLLTIFELIGKIETFTDNLKKNFTKVELQFTTDQKTYEAKLKNFYEAIFGTNGWVDTYLDKNAEPHDLNIDVGNKKVVAHAYKLRDASNEGIEKAESKLRYIIDGYKSILSDNRTFGVDKGNASVNLVKDFLLENQRARSNNAKNINEVPEKGYYVLDVTPKSFGGIYSKVFEQFDKNFKDIQTSVTEKLNKTFIEK